MTEFEGPNDKDVFKSRRPMSEKEEAMLDSLLDDSPTTNDQIRALKYALDLDSGYGEEMQPEILKDCLIDLYLSQQSENNDGD